MLERPKSGAQRSCRRTRSALFDSTPSQWKVYRVCLDSVFKGMGTALSHLKWFVENQG